MTKSLKLSKGQLFGHYAIVPFCLIVPAMTTYSLFQIYVTKTYTGVRTVQELILTGYVWFIPAFLLFYIQRSRLKFKEINIRVDTDTFKKAAMQTAEKLGWTISQISSNSITAIRRGEFLSGSWGELITIIKENDRVLINSICDPDNIISIASWGWNRKNVKTFKDNLESLPTTCGFAKYGLDQQ